MEVKKHPHLSTVRSAVARLALLSAAGHLPPPDCGLSCGPEATYQMIGPSSTETAVAQKQQLATDLPESPFILKAARPDFITRWQQRSNRASPCARGLPKSLSACTTLLMFQGQSQHHHQVQSMWQADTKGHGC